MLKSGASKLASAPLSAKFGISIIIIYMLAALLAPHLAPYGEAEIVAKPFEPWSAQFWLGTDSLGRDMFTRLVFGARNTLGIALMTTTLAFSIGASAGLAAATFGGWTDQILSRLIDVLMSIPQLIFALLLLSIFGTSIPTLIIVIAVLNSTPVFRLTRAVAIDAAVSDYVEAARLRGEGPIWIMTREILPNITATLVAEFGLRFCFVFLLISGLSFLGLGIQPPTADWGSMVRDSATLITYGDITPLLPAGAIALLSVAINLVVDWFLHWASGLKED
ncbi:ABC transporter permease [Mesorhizobium amorphae]|uniref:Proline betaine ABC transporter permease n=1 Tax=Mesorhizobium amorphae CCNWGS0123 TaxID=1082933 RepID=G6Y3E6_9HYPH|nr:ABC transporter permease [Mesorhizobium amorphae]ANT54897.1 ABC transporter permease [Mesorhizobium amorphae CCNWGS0123]EHH13736.1 proline betaine ABC transporter permease [Mesorhizobium amorphae CCNWGS0123]